MFGDAGKWLDKKAKLNFKIYDALFFFYKNNFIRTTVSYSTKVKNKLRTIRG